MIIKSLLIVGVVLLGEQMVLTIDPNAQCHTTNYQFKPEHCRILDESEQGWYFCASSPVPQLIAINEYPRMFKIGVPFDVKTDYSYCGINYASYSLEEYLKVPYVISGISPSKPLLDNFEKHRALAAVTYLKANFFIKSYGGNWDMKGQYGPFFYRTNRQDLEESQALDFMNILGFEGYDWKLRLAWFRFFLPDSMKNSDQTVQYWRHLEPRKTDFEVATDLATGCKDAISGQRCEPNKSNMASTYLESYIPLVLKTTEATIRRANLKSGGLELNLEWSISEKSQFTQTVFQQYPDACKPKLVVIVYDSNPAPHGNTGDQKNTYKNHNIRSVLANFTKVLTWDTEHNKVEDTFNLYDSYNQWANIIKNIAFLKRIGSWIGDDDAKIFYQSWNKDSGLSIAITTCICYYDFTFPLNVDPYKLWIDNRNRGCREYKHHPLSVDPDFWANN